MIDHEGLSSMLHAVVTGFPDRAARVAFESEGLTESERGALMQLLNGGGSPTDAARGIGDLLRSWGAPRDLVNECYRAAFYSSEGPARLARNPMYAYFLAKKGGLVLDKWPHYFEIYDRYLSRFRGTDARVLEIGVYRGGGLDLLRDYLGAEATLVGIDVDPVAAEVARVRHTVELGDQEDPEFLADVVRRHGPFDIVIDDGGHTMAQQIATAEALLPLMPDGSVYIVEDTHTSYWESYGGGLNVEGTFAQWVKGLVDEVNAYHWSVQPEPSRLGSFVDCLHVHDSVTVLDVRRRTPPFSEVVGTWDFLKLSRPLSAIHSELLATRDVALQQAERERSSKEQAWAELQAVRASRSWRLTEPLRRRPKG